MSIFLIAGVKCCPRLAHAIHVAEYLHNNLPCFKYRVQELPETAWKTWLDQLNTTHGWYLTASPIIWKEITRMGGKPYLLGNLSEFWEYCFDYYGFQSRLPKSDLLKLVADNELIASKHKISLDLITIGIISNAHQTLLELIILELQSLVARGKDLCIKLYVDEEDEETLDSILDMVKKSVPVLKCNPHNLKAVASLIEAIKGSDLLILTTDHSRLPEESAAAWLRRCRVQMHFLSVEINMWGRRRLRIVLCQNGPACFNASVLVQYSTRIRPANIVAVTADEGISCLSEAARATDVPMERMGCPPVWGFSGLCSFVDVGGTIITGEVYRPFARAVKSKALSNLPRGRVHKELRVLAYLIEDEEELHNKIDERKKRMVELLGRQPILPKIRALTSLINLWYGEDEESRDSVISLGVISDGSFNFPPGVVFSQAVCLNEKQLWEPFGKLHLSDTAKIKISEMMLSVNDILQDFGLGT